MHKACIDKIEDLNLMADGLLSKEKAEILEKHMSDCSACGLVYNDIISLKKAMSSITLDVPAGINERISTAVRNAPKRKTFTRHIYRYASVAAACLALAVVLFATGTFNGLMKSNDSMESAELQDYGEKSDGRGVDSAAETENALTAKDGIEESGVLPLPEAVAPTDDNDEVLSAINENLADYRFSTSAIEDTETVVVNPGGIPLDSGYGGQQDVFYASGAYTIEEMSTIITSEFNIGDVWGEQDSLFFYMKPNLLSKLEVRLGLVSAEKLTEKKDYVSVRIISVKKSGE